MIGLCIPADELIGPGDRWILRADPLRRPENRPGGDRHQDRQGRQDRVAAQLVAVNELAGDHAAAIVPVSATTGEQVDVLIDVLVDQLEPGPAFYPTGADR